MEVALLMIFYALFNLDKFQVIIVISYYYGKTYDFMFHLTFILQTTKWSIPTMKY